MATPDPLPPRNIGISISESPDMRYFGLTEGHLKDTMADFATQLLSSGASLAYGGDLRDKGFTRLLFELVLRYGPRKDGKPPVTDYLAWPVHATMTTEQILALEHELQGYARLVLVSLDGGTMSCAEHRAVSVSTVDQETWCTGLTAMRRLMRDETDARIVLGGKVEGHKGTVPGVAEEALLAIEAKRPLYLVGGFGGCARDIAETLGLAECWTGSRSTWKSRKSFDGSTDIDLNNGLTSAENRQLAVTNHVDQAITLVVTGLHRLRGGALGRSATHKETRLKKELDTHHVVPNPEGGWDVRRGASGRASSHHDTKQDAVAKARKISRNQGTVLHIHNRDGRVTDSGYREIDPFPLPTNSRRQ